MKGSQMLSWHLPNCLEGNIVRKNDWKICRVTNPKLDSNGGNWSDPLGRRGRPFPQNYRPWLCPCAARTCHPGSAPAGIELSGNITINKRHSIFHLLIVFLRAYFVTAQGGFNLISIHLLGGERAPGIDLGARGGGWEGLVHSRSAQGAASPAQDPAEANVWLPFVVSEALLVLQ